jgi:hypothetical protein
VAGQYLIRLFIRFPGVDHYRQAKRSRQLELFPKGLSLEFGRRKVAIEVEANLADCDAMGRLCQPRKAFDVARGERLCIVGVNANGRVCACHRIGHPHRAAAAFDVVADYNHGGDAGFAGAADDCIVIAIELGVLEVAVGVYETFGLAEDSHLRNRAFALLRLRSLGPAF